MQVLVQGRSGEGHDLSVKGHKDSVPGAIRLTDEEGAILLGSSVVIRMRSTHATASVVVGVDVHLVDACAIIIDLTKDEHLVWWQSLATLGGVQIVQLDLKEPVEVVDELVAALLREARGKADAQLDDVKAARQRQRVVVLEEHLVPCCLCKGSQVLERWVGRVADVGLHVDKHLGLVDREDVESHLLLAALCFHIEDEVGGLSRGVIACNVLGACEAPLHSAIVEGPSVGVHASWNNYVGMTKIHYSLLFQLISLHSLHSLPHCALLW